MKTVRLMLTGLLVCACAVAQANKAPAKGHDKGKAASASVAGKDIPETLAEGFPKWTGLGSRLGSSGRPVTAAELRGSYTVVVLLDAGSIKKQIGTALGVSGLSGDTPSKRDWIFGGFGRGILVVYVVKGGKADTLKSLFEDKKVGAGAKKGDLNWYSDLTFAGAPTDPGKTGYVYVMAPGETKPIFQGAAAGSKSRAQITKAIDAFEQQHAPWRPWFGIVKDPTLVKGYSALVASGRPLAAMELTLQKNCAAKKPELARESQLLYDAIEATKGFYIGRLHDMAKLAPQATLYDGNELVKRLPKARSEIADKLEWASSQPDALAMSKIVAEYFAAADEEKAVAVVKKNRAALEKIKNSKCIPVQNTAFTLLQKIQ